jgi:hypothetical protein
MIVNTLPSVLL